MVVLMEASEGIPPSDSSSGDTTAYILTLDEGLLNKICSSLATTDLLSAQCTCKQLQAFIGNDKTLWRSLSFPHSLGDRLDDARLMVLVARANGGLEALELRGGKQVTGSFLLSDGMKASTKLRKLWLLECPNLSSSTLLHLVGHLVQTSSREGLTPQLSSLRVAGSLHLYSKHVQLLEKLLPPPSCLDVTACPNCPKAGKVLTCRMVTLLEAMAGEGTQQHALVRGGEIGCESCLVRCALCNEFYCSAHLFDLPCGLLGICCQCCGYHQCYRCRSSRD